MVKDILSHSLMVISDTCISMFSLKKSEALNAFKIYKAEVEKQLDKKIKIIRFNKGGEYYERYIKRDQSMSRFGKFLQKRILLPNIQYLEYHNKMVWQKKETVY